MKCRQAQVWIFIYIYLYVHKNKRPSSFCHFPRSIDVWVVVVGEGTCHVSAVDASMCVSSKDSTLPLISLSFSLSHFSLLTSSILLSFLLCSHFWQSVENSSSSITDEEKESSPSSHTHTVIHYVTTVHYGNHTGSLPLSFCRQAVPFSGHHPVLFRLMQLKKKCSS